MARRVELIEARNKAGYKQLDMEVLGISRSYYSQIELGTKHPTYGLAKKIARKLKVPVRSIFFDVDCYKMRPRKCGSTDPNDAA